MRSLYSVISCFLFINLYDVDAVPPEACLANFRWDDCGKPPQPVIYYWKPGSRCEVGIWRGCLPNMNMFADEHECVSTCIFSPRAMPEDFHNRLVYDVMEEEQETSTIGDTTDNGNATETGDPQSNATSSDTTKTISENTDQTGKTDQPENTTHPKNTDNTESTGQPKNTDQAENTDQPVTADQPENPDKLKISEKTDDVINPDKAENAV